MKHSSRHRIQLLVATILATAMSLASVRIHNSNASFHTFDDIPTFPSFSPILALPPGGGSSSPSVGSPLPTFQECLSVTCKGIPAFTPAFNDCLRECFAGQKTATGGAVTSITSSVPSSFSSIQSSAPLPIHSDQPFCIDTQGEKTFDRMLCASSTVQGTIFFPSRSTPSRPIDDLIVEFLGITLVEPPPPVQPSPAHDVDPLKVLTALYTVFQRLPEFLKILTESTFITSAALDQAYQGYRDARLELLNARTQCAEFYQASGKTPCTVALRSSVYALGKIRISTQSILFEDPSASARMDTLFKDLTKEWNKTNTPTIPLQPSIEIPPGQPFLE